MNEINYVSLSLHIYFCSFEFLFAYHNTVWLKTRHWCNIISGWNMCAIVYQQSIITLWHCSHFMKYCGSQLQRERQKRIERWKRGCQWEVQPLNHLSLWLTLLCTWPVIRETPTGTMFTSIIQRGYISFSCKTLVCLIKQKNLSPTNR